MPFVPLQQGAEDQPSETTPPKRGFTPLPTEPAPRSTAAEVVRQLGLTVRHAVAGAAALPAMAGDALATGYNKTADLVAGEGNGYRFPSQMAALQQGLSNVGLPEPETATERVVGNVTEAMSGTGASVKAGQVLAGAANKVASGVGAQLQQGVGAQTAAAASGGAAAGTVRENGGGAGAQFAAGLLGAMAPAGLPTAAREAGRRVLRGGEEGRQRVEDSLKLFQDAAGTTPTLAQATGGRAAQALEAGLSKVPGGAGVMTRFAQRQADDMQVAIQRISDDLAPNANAVNAGEAIQRGVDAFKKGFQEVQHQMYERLGQALPKDTDITVDRTRAALAAMNEGIEGAPSLSKWFKNAKIQGIEGALLDDTGGPAAVLSRPGMREQAEALRQRLVAEAQTATAANEKHRANLMVQIDEAKEANRLWRIDQHEQAAQARAANVEWRDGLRAEAAATIARNAERKQLGMTTNLERVMTDKEINALPDKFPVMSAKEINALPAPNHHLSADEVKALAAPNMVRNQAAIEKEVSDFLSGSVTGKLPYEAIKKLRTLVGREITDGSLVSDVPRSKWKQLYGALSEDLGDAAKAAGPKAEEAWASANDYTSQHMRRLEELSSIVMKDAPEKVFTAAISGTAEGNTVIQRVMSALPAEERREVAAAVLQRLGRATPGQQNAAGDAFSSATFLTNLAKMSPAAKATVFGPGGAGKDKIIAQLAKIAELRREGGAVFANPSGTASAATQIAVGSGIGGALAGSMATGNIGPVAAAALPVVGSNVMARAVTSPKLVMKLAKRTTIPAGMQGSAVNATARLSAASDLPPEQREVGAVYETPRGRMQWRGDGWVPAP